MLRLKFLQASNKTMMKNAQSGTNYLPLLRLGLICHGIDYIIKEAYMKIN